MNKVVYAFKILLRSKFKRKGAHVTHNAAVRVVVGGVKREHDFAVGRIAERGSPVRRVPSFKKVIIQNTQLRKV
jgi:hypothetical protein